MAFDDPTWTLNEAVSWAMWRLPEALSQHPYFTVNFVDDDDLSFDGAVQHLSLAAAEDAILHLMQRGRVRVSGGGRILPPEEIAAAEVMESDGALRLGFSLDGGRENRPKGSIPVPQQYYDRLRLNADDLRLHLTSSSHSPASVVRILDGDGSRETPINRPSSKPSSGKAARARGAPTKYHWQEFQTECQRLWDENGGFSDDDLEFCRPSHLVHLMQDWCISQAERKRSGWPRCPADSLVRAKVAEFLKSAGWSANNIGQ